VVVSAEVFDDSDCIDDDDDDVVVVDGMVVVVVIVVDNVIVDVDVDKGVVMFNSYLRKQYILHNVVEC